MKNALFTMNRNAILSLTLLSLLLFAGCNKEEIVVDNEYVAFTDSVSYVSPKTLLTLEKTQGKPAFQNRAMRNFMIFDSLMLIEGGRKNGQIEAVSRKSEETLFAFLNQGNGNAETVQSITFASWVTFFEDGDSLFCSVFDKQRKRMLRINITQSLQDKHLHIACSFPNLPIKIPAFWAKTVGDSVAICKYMEQGTRQVREIYRDSVALSMPSLDRLNEIKIPEGEDINIISSMIVVHPRKALFAEIMRDMNYLNIYSLDQQTLRTVCVEKKMTKLSDILNLPQAKRPYYFANAKAYDFGFAVLKLNVTEWDYQTDADYRPSILFFDWEGHSLGEVKADFKFSRFELDEKNKLIYLLDDEDQLRCFDFDVDMQLKNQV